MGDRTTAGRDEFARYWNGAVEVPGPVTDRLGELAADARTHLVIGVVEREYGTLYCTVLSSPTQEPSSGSGASSCLPAPSG